MKKLLSATLGLLASLSLVGCGGASTTESPENTIVIGASSTPHADILEAARPLLNEKGFDLNIVVFQDFVLPNKALVEGELDANYFQHIPWLEQSNADNGTDLTVATGVHIEPIGIYSAIHESLADLPEGARIIMSNSVSDQGRLLGLLQSYGLITLDPEVDIPAARLDDIIENPHNFVFEANIDAGMLVQAYRNNEGDAVLINTNFALDGGLNPMEDALALESSDSPFVNVVAVNAGDENSEKIQALVEVLHSEEIYNFIIETFEGAVVPVTQ